MLESTSKRAMEIVSIGWEKGAARFAAVLRHSIGRIRRRGDSLANGNSCGFFETFSGFTDGHKKMVVGLKSAWKISQGLSLGRDDCVRNEVVQFVLRQTGGPNLFLGF